jgi:hypothetical protein
MDFSICFSFFTDKGSVSRWDIGVSTQPTMGVYKVDELFEAEIVITTKFYPVSSPLKGIKTLQKIYLAL